MEAQPREIRNYETADGRSPFQEWLDSLRDIKARVRIEKRLERVALGSLGDYRSVGEGAYELKIDYGPGYRLYFGQIGSTIVLLLCGGDKSTQEQDILRDHLQSPLSLENETQCSVSEALFDALERQNLRLRQ